MRAATTFLSGRGGGQAVTRLYAQERRGKPENSLTTNPSFKCTSTDGPRAVGLCIYIQMESHAVSRSVTTAVLPSSLFRFNFLPKISREELTLGFPLLPEPVVRLFQKNHRNKICFRKICVITFNL
jgi:hypothetical protein